MSDFRGTPRLLAGGAATAMAAALLTATPAQAATYSVHTVDQLRSAVAQANAHPGRDVIWLKRNINFTPTSGTDADGPEAGDLDITDDLVVRSNRRTIDARQQDRIFDVAAGVEFRAEHLTLRGGAPQAGASGGAIRSAGSTMLTSVTLTGNKVSGAGASGGGVFNDDGDLTVQRSTLRGNNSERAGGGIEANEGRTYLWKTTLAGNDAGTGPGNGGALHLTGAGWVKVVGSTVSNNQAVEGGGLWNSGTGTMVVERSTIKQNSASGDAADQGGGGVYNDGGTVRVKHSYLGSNTADGVSGSGGGALNNTGSMVFSNSTLYGNRSQRAGGGVEAIAGSTTIERSSLKHNKTGDNPGNGGGLHLTGEGTVEVSKSVLHQNRAGAEGGGLWNSASGTMRVQSTKFWGNVATGDAADNGGGAVFNDGGSLTVDGSVLVGNRAPGSAGSGGGVFVNGGTASISHTSILGGSAARAGGGIETVNADLTLRWVRLIGNTAGANPGNGGGLHLTGTGTVDYRGGTVLFNRASNEGGGLWNSVDGTITVTKVKVGGNRAPVGPNLFTLGGPLTVNGEPVQPN